MGEFRAYEGRRKPHTIFRQVKIRLTFSQVKLQIGLRYLTAVHLSVDF